MRAGGLALWIIRGNGRSCGEEGLGVSGGPWWVRTVSCLGRYVDLLEYLLLGETCVECSAGLGCMSLLCHEGVGAYRFFN